MKTVGILALQGDFEAHRKAVEHVGGRAVEVRTAADLNSCDGLIIPGGESTTMLKLLDQEQLTDPIKDFGARKPIFGSCAGAILLARSVTHPAQPSLGLMDIAVERNAYGRQLNSRIVRVPSVLGEIEAVFIRAPIIREAAGASSPSYILASYNGDPIWVEQGRHTITTFHPELTRDSKVHARFLSKL